MNQLNKSVDDLFVEAFGVQPPKKNQALDKQRNEQARRNNERINTGSVRSSVSRMPRG